MNAITKLIGTALLCLMAGCAGNSGAGEGVDGLTVIDVESAMGNLQAELTLSDVADSVWYLPLETTDASLVGECPSARLLGGFVVVSANSGNMPEYDERSGWLYFTRYPNSLQKFDVEGHYQGKLTLSGIELSNCSLVSADSLLVCYPFHIPLFEGENKLFLFNTRGQAVDSVIFPWAEPPVAGKDLVSIDIQDESMGRLYLKYADKSFWVWEADKMDVQDGQVTFHPAFSDTLYALSGNSLRPLVALHTGKYQFPAVKGRTVESGYSDRLVTKRIAVTPGKICFSCELDTYGERKLYEGIYDRRTGHTRLSPASQDGYKDDLTGFMPVPWLFPQGVQVSLIEAYKVVEWLDEHPEARDNPALAVLAQVQEEDNPVVVFVRYKSE